MRREIRVMDVLGRLYHEIGMAIVQSISNARDLILQIGLPHRRCVAVPDRSRLSEKKTG